VPRPRRAFLRQASAAVAALLMGGAAADCASAPRPRSPQREQHGPGSPPRPLPASAGLRGYAFGAAQADVTVFDPTSYQVIATQPLGTSVTWLSNEQRFWDGTSIWTYDFPGNVVRAIAIDPIALRISRTIPTGGRGPAHSLMLTPDRRSAWVNVAGEDYLAEVNLAAGEVVAQVPTGHFP
jgi:hypothetical protein